MHKKYLIDRQGRQFVLYAGLLDEAHTKGLKAIRTTLLQPPLPQNGETAIAHAEVELEDGRVFSGIGDANQGNVGRNIAPHIVRMAETRAKARALRDAINVAEIALEELGDLDDEQPGQGLPPARPLAGAFPGKSLPRESRESREPRESRNEPRQEPRPAPVPAVIEAVGPEPATGAQIAAIKRLGGEVAEPVALTRGQAGELIRRLQARGA